LATKTTRKSKAVTYRDAGVDIDAGNQAVRLMKAAVRSTFNRQVLGDLGSFGGLFAFDKARYKEPVLVSSTDGVGTKIKVAALAGVYGTVGQDLVNHCVNDILVQGARPLFFLDYVAMGRLDPVMVASMVGGLAKACREQKTVLIGGETAEMPGLYAAGDFDLAGTIVGVAEKKKIITGEGIKPGDVVLALPSTGLHTNGFSLARKILFEKKRYKTGQRIKGLPGTLGEALLAVHKCYAQPILGSLQAGIAIQGLAHITGGGLENIPRVLPEGCQVQIQRGTWPVPPIFKLIVEDGSVPEADAYRALNMGLGLIIIVRPAVAKPLVKKLAGLRQQSYLVGEVVKGPKKAVLVG
jgi:phosphoribosylformylglycinamidine cyclo-ligase